MLHVKPVPKATRKAPLVTVVVCHGGKYGPSPSGYKTSHRQTGDSDQYIAVGGRKGDRRPENSSTRPVDPETCLDVERRHVAYSQSTVKHDGLPIDIATATKMFRNTARNTARVTASVYSLVNHLAWHGFWGSVEYPA